MSESNTQRKKRLAREFNESSDKPVRMTARDRKRRCFEMNRQASLIGRFASMGDKGKMRKAGYNE